MSLFSSLMGDMVEEDPFFGSHMRTMRQMNNMMNSLFADPFGMMGPDLAGRALTHQQQYHRSSIGNIHNSLMSFGGGAAGGGFPMPNYNRLLSGSLDSLGDSHSFSSSTVVSMSSGPDGRPQVYKATSSTRTQPGGIKETQRTMSDSRTGTKKMAIGHHIGERAHIVEREQNVHSGDQEERQDFINIEEDDAEDFNREWSVKTRSRSEVPRLSLGGGGGRPGRHSYSADHSVLPAITAGPSRRHRERAGASLVAPRRAIRSPHHHALLSPPASSSLSANRGPYTPPGQPQHVRKHKNIKTVSGSPPSPAAVAAPPSPSQE